MVRVGRTWSVLTHSRVLPVAQKVQIVRRSRRATGSFRVRSRLGASILSAMLLLLTLVGCGQQDTEGAPEASSTSSTTTMIGTEQTGPDHPDPDDLTDGTHLVTVDSADVAAGTITVDGIEVLEGAEAALAYLEDTDGNQLEGPQAYVRNVSRVLQDLPVDSQGEFSVIFGPECCEPQDQGWQGFAELAGSGFPDVWGVAPPFEVTINNGIVTSLVQTYLA